MKKTLLYILILMVGLGLLFACNKQKPIKLDYTEKQDMYDAKGLPGESHIGSPPEDQKHTGYKHGDKDKPDEKKKEKDKEKDKEKSK